MYMLFFIMAILAAQVQDSLPIAQVRIDSRMHLYDEPSYVSIPTMRIRPGDILILYDIQAGWGQAAEGWVPLTTLTPEPAIVQAGGVLKQDVDVQNGASLEKGSPVGIAALFEGDALVYAARGMGWVPLRMLEITDPQPDIVDFVEQVAYVKRESTALYAQPQPSAAVAADLQLGKQVTILYLDQDWALIKTEHAVGWGLVAHFDRVLAPQARGQMNVGPVNFRRSPENGAIMTVLDYLQPVLVLGRSADKQWLLVRARGLDGWVAAEFVDFEGLIDDLPTTPTEGN